MSCTWNTLRVGDGHMEVVEVYSTLDDALRDVQLLAWEDPGGHWLDYFTEDSLVVAVAIYSGDALTVACADGRRMEFTRPEGY